MDGERAFNAQFVHRRQGRAIGVRHVHAAPASFPKRERTVPNAGDPAGLLLSAGLRVVTVLGWSGSRPVARPVYTGALVLRFGGVSRAAVGMARQCSRWLSSK